MTRNRTNRFALRTLAGATIALTTGAAHAGVSNYGGNIYAGVQTSPPSNHDLRLNATEDNTRTRVYLEQSNILLQSTIYYNAHLNGTYQQNSALVHQAIPGTGSATVNSYILHFDPTSGIRTRTSQGFIEFTNPIYVISRNSDLDASDIRFGMTGVQYATGPLSDRGYDLASNDAFWISTPQAGVWRLDFYARSSTGMDELRVIEMVSVPSPAPLALLGLGGLFAARRR